MRQLKGFSRSKSWIWAALVCSMLPAMPEGSAATLTAQTQNAFEHYVQLTEQRNQQELGAEGAFLWIDGLPEAQRKKVSAEVANGEVIVARVETRDARKEVMCPGGMIHHWIATVFIPGARLDQVLSVLEDYDHHSEYYQPDVERSHIESRDGNHLRVFLRFRRTKVVTIVLDTVHDVQYYRDTPVRAHSRSSAIRIAQVDDPGKSDEREKTPGNDDGFLWGMETWWRMEEKHGGVYVQSEVVSLTRDIPAGLGWIIGPFVTTIPRESLKFTMEATRRAVLRKEQSDLGDGPGQTSSRNANRQTPLLFKSG